MIPEDFNFDFKKIHQELSATYKRQMEIKKEYPHHYSRPRYTRERWKSGEYRKELESGRPWKLARQEFNNLSWQMTKLCCILNEAKGKLHMKSWEGEPFDREAQAKLISDQYKDFELVEEVPKIGLVARLASAMGF